jgi:hypothetical protein
VGLFLAAAFCVGAMHTTAAAVTKTWDAGAGTANWTDATNWNPDGIPASPDDVILDNSSVAGSYTVTLSGASVQTVHSLQVGYSGNANSIELDVSSATTSVLTANGGGATALHITDGGVLKNLSTSGTRGILLNSATDVFKMSGTGRYIHAATTSGSKIPQRTSGTTGANYDFANTSVFENQSGIAASFDSTPNYGSYRYNLSTTSSASADLTINGDLSVLQGTLGVSASTTNTFTIAGGLSISNGATLRGASTTGTATINITGSVTGAGTLQGSAASGATTSITVGGDLTSLISFGTGTNSLTFAGGATAVSFTPASGAIVKSVTLSNGKTVALGANISSAAGTSLTINSGGQLNCGINVISGPGSVVVNGTLGVGSTSATDAVGGNVNAATLTLNSGSTVEFNGSGAQFAGARTFEGLKTNNGNGVTLNADISVNRTLTLTNGKIATGGNTLTLGNSATATGGSTASYVIGKLKKTTVPATFTFEVGTTNGYTPLNLTAAGGGGDLTVKTAATVAPLVDPSKSLQEFWTLISGGTLTTDLTFNYLDSDVMGNESLYRIIRVESGTAVTFENIPPINVDTVNNTAFIPGVSHFSDWTLGQPAAPTAVRLARFNATSYESGVELNWDSGFEVNNLGYHLYRERDGKRTRVTPSVVAGSALAVGPGSRLNAGNSYSWFDAQGTANTVYYLESIDLNGARELTGPIYPAAGNGDVPLGKGKRALLLSEVGSAATGGGASAETSWATTMKREARSETKLRPKSLSVQQQIAAGQAVKLAVRRTGWYRVSQAELLTAGLNPAVDARLLQLYVDGAEVPIRISGEGPQLGASDTVEFYGVALDTPTTDTRLYYLVAGNTAGKRISAKRSKGKPGDQMFTENVVRNFSYTTERREKLVYISNLLNGEAENIFGPAVTTEPATQTLSVKSLDRESDGPAQIEVALQGLTAQHHQVQVQLNGANLGVMTFVGREHPVTQFTANPAQLHDGDNTVTLVASNGHSDVSFVDWVRLSYAHQYRADRNALNFSVPGGQTVRVDGFMTPNIRVMDVTNPSSVTEVATVVGPSGGGYAVRLQTAGAEPRTLIAFADDQAAHPLAVTANQPSSWNASTNGADLVIVTHKDFRQSIEPLANLRRSQGMSVAVVDVEDVYDEFSYGTHTPAAVKGFLSWAASHWSRKPGYLLLVGDSSWDPRNYLTQGENDFVPTKLIDTLNLETSSDDWLADFGETGLADMAVGRLPGRTSAEVSLMVGKIMAYEQERETGGPLRGAVMVADNGFESQSNEAKALLPAGMTVQTINRSEVGNDNLMRGQIVNALDQGPLIVNYYGHGSVTVWTGAGLLSSTLASSLTNSNKLSLFVMMTCLNGYAQDAYIDSLGEALLKAEHGGAVAVWASSGFTEPQPQSAMAKEFYRQLFGAQPVRLGEAVRHAKTVVTDNGVRRTWILLGDPTMYVR